MFPERFERIVRTARYLKAVQIFGRLYYGSRKLRVRRYDTAERRNALREWESPAFSTMSTRDGFEFFLLGEPGHINGQEDWNAPNHAKLWLYKLHYLDDLNALEADQAPDLLRGLVSRWILENPPPHGNGWEPYPLSLRIVNLVKWLARQVEFESSWLPSLATQAGALSKRVEFHIQGNHLFANGKALVFAGSYLAGRDPDRWLAQGLRILDEQIAEQFLPDGAHFELSPMYHAILTWDLCDLVNLAARSRLLPFIERTANWRDVTIRAIKWLRRMQHPDGGLPFFNDASFGVAPTLADIERYASQLECCPPPEDMPVSMPYCTHHPDSGYIVVDTGPGCRALLDVARVGPDYQPGHAHADTLSFELSLFGHRVFVNSGTSCYGEDAERQRQRGTASHNTVEIDGENSSEVWAGFRVARRAYPRLERIERRQDRIHVCASHDGYRRLKGRNLHSREWVCFADSIRIADTVTGSCNTAVARLHVHPAVHFESHDGTLRASLGGGSEVSVHIEGARHIGLVDSTWHPEFGKSQSNQCIVAEFSSGTLDTTIRWRSSV